MCGHRSTRQTDTICVYVYVCDHVCRASLRDRIHGVFRVLVADGGRLALDLVDAFGIPDHLLQAPIALDWRRINATA